MHGLPAATTVWLGIPFPTPEAASREQTRGVGGGKKRIVVELACASFVLYRSRASGFFAFGIGWLFDWPTALEMAA